LLSVRGATLGLLVLGGLMLAGDWALESMEMRPRGVVEGMVRSVHVSSPQSGAEALFKATGCTSRFFLAWTTSSDSFRLRYRRTIESTLRFHPEACVVVFSPTLPVNYFQTFWDLGYNVIVVRPDIRALLEGTPAEGWLREVERHREGKYFYSHVTDIFRFATLYRYGGIYLDTDVIVMRDMGHLENCVGAELAGEHGEAKILNGAIMAFPKRGSRFLWDCMAEFNATYRGDLWGWNGPELVTRVAARYPRDDGQLRILPTLAFYPIHWTQIKKYFAAEALEEQHAVWMDMQRHTYLIHYWNKVTQDLVPESGSLMYKVLNNFCLMCNETSADDGLPHSEGSFAAA